MSLTRQALIVEDNRDVAGELEALLNGMGFKVTTIQDPTQATETLGEHQYELAFMNMTLPEMTWKRTLTTIKSAARTTTVMMMRREASEDDVRLALNSGAYVVLNRPITSEQLSHLISPKSDGMLIVLRG
ncbi:MAG: response regulator [Chloroflexi bacterium]|nr:response regulator [Chloroflexota bacterium]